MLQLLFYETWCRDVQAIETIVSNYFPRSNSFWSCVPLGKIRSDHLLVAGMIESLRHHGSEGSWVFFPDHPDAERWSNLCKLLAHEVCRTIGTLEKQDGLPGCLQAFSLQKKPFDDPESCCLQPFFRTCTAAAAHFLNTGRRLELQFPVENENVSTFLQRFASSTEWCRFVQPGTVELIPTDSDSFRFFSLGKIFLHFSLAGTDGRLHAVLQDVVGSITLKDGSSKVTVTLTLAPRPMERMEHIPPGAVTHMSFMGCITAVTALRQRTFSGLMKNTTAQGVCCAIVDFEAGRIPGIEVCHSVAPRFPGLSVRLLGSHDARFRDRVMDVGLALIACKLEDMSDISVDVYVLVDRNPRLRGFQNLFLGPRVVGFWSAHTGRAKIQPKMFLFSCFAVWPWFTVKGYGTAIVEINMMLAREKKLVASPETPFSEAGSAVIFKVYGENFRRHLHRLGPQERISWETLAVATSITHRHLQQLAAFFQSDHQAVSEVGLMKRLRALGKLPDIGPQDFADSTLFWFPHSRPMSLPGKFRAEFSTAGDSRSCPEDQAQTSARRRTISSSSPKKLAKVSK